MATSTTSPDSSHATRWFLPSSRTRTTRTMRDRWTTCIGSSRPRRRPGVAALHIVTLPFPRAVMMNGERLPASYANFYMANGVVLVPTFNDPNDRVALDILANLIAFAQCRWHPRRRSRLGTRDAALPDTAGASTVRLKPDTTYGITGPAEAGHCASVGGGSCIWARRSTRPDPAYAAGLLSVARLRATHSSPHLALRLLRSLRRSRRRDWSRRRRDRNEV